MRRDARESWLHVVFLWNDKINVATSLLSGTVNESTTARRRYGRTSPPVSRCEADNSPAEREKVDLSSSLPKDSDADVQIVVCEGEKEGEAVLRLRNQMVEDLRKDSVSSRSSFRRLSSPHRRSSRFSLTKFSRKSVDMDGEEANLMISPTEDHPPELAGSTEGNIRLHST